MSINPRSQPYRLDPPVDDKTLPQIVTNADEMFQILFEDIVALDAGIDAAIAAAAASSSVSTPGPKGPPGKEGTSGAFNFRMPPGGNNTNFVPYVGAVRNVDLGVNTLTTPTIIGGTAAGSSLTLQATSGVGTTDFIKFVVGNNGATEAARFDFNGDLQLGTAQYLYWNNRTLLHSSADGRMEILNFATTSGIMLDVTTDNIFQLLSRGGVESTTLRSSNIFATAVAVDADVTAVTGPLKLAAISQSAVSFSFVNVGFGNQASGPATVGLKTRSTASSDANTIVVNGDEILGLWGYAADGATYRIAAQILFSVDGTPGIGDMPGRITFSTSLDGTATLVERMRITNAGLVGVGLTPTALLHLKAGTATANTAPLKFNSGTVLTTAEAGAVEFTTDDFFATITTGAARKAFVLDDGARLTSGKIPVASTNGRLIDGQTPLAGAKVYWVSDTSGGAVNRKLTFTNGILTAET